MNLLVGVVLSVCAIEDWFTKKISVWCPVTGLMTAVVIRLREGSFMDLGCWLGVLIGILFFLLAIISRERIGKGDGLVLIVCGFCLSWKATLSLVLGSMILFLTVGVLKVICQNTRRDTTMAYIPFLWVMFMVSLII